MLDFLIKRENKTLKLIRKIKGHKGVEEVFKQTFIRGYMTYLSKRKKTISLWAFSEKEYLAFIDMLSSRNLLAFNEDLNIEMRNYRKEKMRIFPDYFENI